MSKRVFPGCIKRLTYREYYEAILMQLPYAVCALPAVPDPSEACLNLCWQYDYKTSNRVEQAQK